jgi:mannose-1-phosphate guanylyltransferase/phosphomannomutase
VESACIHCPWEHMGRIMRLLISETDQRDLNLTDGIKISRDGYWALILPDSEQPLLHIYAEGRSAKDAVSILKRYTARIEEYLEKGCGT